jgi:hypothetical protein
MWFGPGAGAAHPAIDVKSLHAKIGELFRRSAHRGGIAERKAMIDRTHDLPISKQAEAPPQCVCKLCGTRRKRFLMAFRIGVAATLAWHVGKPP